MMCVRYYYYYYYACGKQIQPRAASAAAAAGRDEDGVGDDRVAPCLPVAHRDEQDAADAEGAVGGALLCRISDTDASGAASNEVPLDEAVVFMDI